MYNDKCKCNEYVTYSMRIEIYNNGRLKTIM